jgi:hypothetical protein
MTRRPAGFRFHSTLVADSEAADPWFGDQPEMAIRLSIAFNTTAESWLRQQI